jgi:hypothetical protein
LVVGDEECRGAQSELKAADDVAHLCAHLGIERAERFIKQQHGGLEHQRTGQGDALLLSAGELVGVSAGEVADLDEFEHLGHLSGPRCG